MNEQTVSQSPSTATTGRVPTRPRERGLEGINVKPVTRRLTRMVGQQWTHVSATIDGLDGMHRAEIRSAYLRCVGENVATSEEVQPNAPYYVDANGCLARRASTKTEVAQPTDATVLPEEAQAFLANRVIGVRGETYFWFDPIPSKMKTFAKTCPNTGTPVYHHMRTTAFRQGRALNQAETETFKDFDPAVCDAILAKAPAFSSPPAN